MELHFFFGPLIYSMNHTNFMKVTYHVIIEEVVIFLLVRFSSLLVQLATLTLAPHWRPQHSDTDSRSLLVGTRGIFFYWSNILLVHVHPRLLGSPLREMHNAHDDDFCSFCKSGPTQAWSMTWTPVSDPGDFWAQPVEILVFASPTGSMWTSSGFPSSHWGYIL